MNFHYSSICMARDPKNGNGVPVGTHFDDALPFTLFHRSPNEGLPLVAESKQFAWEKLFDSPLLLGKIDPNRV